MLEPPAKATSQWPFLIDSTASAIAKSDVEHADCTLTAGPLKFR